MEAALGDAAKQSLGSLPHAVNGDPIKPLLRMFTRHLPEDPVEAHADLAGGRVRHMRTRAFNSPLDFACVRPAAFVACRVLPH